MPIWSPAMIFGSAASGYVVENSIYLDGSADYLSFTPFTAGSKQDFTISLWMKLVNPDFSSTSYVLSAGDGTGNEEFAVAFLNSEILRIFSVSSGSTYQNFDYRTSQVFRDPTAWQNWVITFDHDNGTAGDRLRLFINGSEVTSFGTETNPVDGETAYWTDAVAHNIGRTVQGSNYAPMYLAEVINLDGTSVTDATNFGEYNNNGVWIPKDPSGLTFGTNGFHLKFDEANLLGKSSNSTTNPTSSFLGSQTFGSAATAFTVTGATLGDAASNRTIVIAVGGGRSTAGTRTVNTLTVGGSSATFIARKNSGAGNVLEFWSIDVSSGTSANIVATFSAAMATVGIAWWRVLDAGTPISTDGNTASGWSTQSVTTIGQTGDIAFYAIYDEGDADAYAWSDATERSEAIDISSTRSFTSADYTFTSAESHTETATISGGSGNDNAFVGVTFSNNNSFVANSLAAANQVTDTCTDSADDNIGNYPTWSPIDKESNVTLSEGNTVAEQDSTGAWKSVFATQVVPSSGKWVWEIKQSGGNPFGGYATTGVASVNVDRTIARSGSGAITFDYQSSSNKIRKFGGGATEADYAGSVSMSSGEAFQFAIDSDAETLEIYVNNTKITDSGGATLDISSLTKPYKIISQLYSGGTVDHTLVANSADFENNVPSGYKTINTANLPSPTITNSGDFFNTVLYTGNGSSRTISGVGFQPDWVWIKDRNVGENHYSFDAVRGAEKRVHQNTADAEGTESTALTGFVSDGFTLGNGSAGANTNTRTYVAWCWKAETAWSESGSGSGIIVSSGKKSSSAKFSIAKWAHQTSNYAFRHNLGTTPEFVITKSLAQATNWSSWHKDLADTAKRIILNSSAAEASSFWADASDTSTPYGNISSGESPVTSTLMAISGDEAGAGDMIGYFFARTTGAIAIGKYTGNGSADGPFVQVDDGGSGFKPAWIIIKRISGVENWFMFDNKRDIDNPAEHYLLADSSNTENDGSGGNDVDFIANGFKLRSTNAGTNASSSTYIYLAFAENPFGGSGVAQAKAR